MIFLCLLTDYLIKDLRPQETIIIIVSINLLYDMYIKLYIKKSHLLARGLLYYTCPVNGLDRLNGRFVTQVPSISGEYHSIKEFQMKKVLITIAIAFLVIGAASAQAWRQGNQTWTAPQGMGRTAAPVYGRGLVPNATVPAVTLEKVSLEGTLELVSGRVAIKEGDKTYFVMIPSRLYGFVDGLDEGAKVKVEGDSHEIVGLANNFAVRVSSLVIGDKTIDLSETAVARGQVGGMMGGQRGGQMGGRTNGYHAPTNGMGWKGR